MSKAKISSQEVEKVAKLANLKLVPKEVKKFQKQLSDVLSYVEVLDKLDTREVEPTSQVTGLTNISREDQTQPSLSLEEALKNARNRLNGYFKVPAVIPDRPEA